MHCTRRLGLLTINGQKTVCVVTLDGQKLGCRRPSTSNRPVKIDVLVARENPLGFDLLIDMNTIKGLGDVTIIQSGSVAFLDSKPSLCAAITINEKDCNTQFDRTSKVLTAG